MGFAKVGDARKKGTERERERERETSPPALSRSLSTFSTLDAPGKKKLPSLLRRQVLPRGGRTYTLCGTPDYIAPEVLLNRGHGRGADWWSFGVLVYEALAGFPPFCAPDPADTYRRIVAGEWACPAHFSAAARDLVRRLLTADLSSRIGCLAGGAGDVKRHAWFRGVDWALLAAARTPAAAAARAAKAGAPAPAALGSAVVLPAPPIVPRGGNGAEDDTSNFDDFSGMAESNGGGASGGGNSGGSGGGGSDGSGLGRAEQAQFSDF
jgi:serine/threonine protein kinase